MSFDHPHLFPETESSVPAIVERIWNAKDVHFGTSTRLPLTYDRLITLLGRDGGPTSQSTIERARRHYPTLLFPWPLTREAKRPWLSRSLVQLLEEGRLLNQRTKVAAQANGTLKPEDGVPLTGTMFSRDGHLVEIECTMDPETGQLSPLVGRIVKVAVGAVLSAAAALDLADGRIDHIVRWCRVLMENQRFLG